MFVFGAIEKKTRLRILRFRLGNLREIPLEFWRLAHRFRVFCLFLESILIPRKGNVFVGSTWEVSLEKIATSQCYQRKRSCRKIGNSFEIRSFWCFSSLDFEKKVRF